MPIAVKLIVNIFFFVIYLLISIVLWNFLYWFFVSQLLGENVPWSSDPVHMKIAWVILLIVVLFTLVFRKYFYISLTKKEKITKKIDIPEVKEFSFDDMAKNISFKEEEKKKPKVEKKKQDWELEILMGKEIK